MLPLRRLLVQLEICVPLFVRLPWLSRDLQAPNGRLSEVVAQFVSAELLLALEYLHANGVSDSFRLGAFSPA